jgi:hypothetical protein
MGKIVRDPIIASGNWQARSIAAQAFWESQVSKAAWKSYASSTQAETNYAAALNKAIANKSRAKAIMATSDANWQAGVTANASRFTQGISASKGRYNESIAKIITDIKASIASMPARGPRGSTTNITTRGTAIQTALAANRGKYKSYLPKAGA